MEDHVEHAFMALEAALLSAREDDLVDDEVLLVVTATDPGPRLFKLMTKAAEGLNSPELFARWLAAQGQ